MHHPRHESGGSARSLKGKIAVLKIYVSTPHEPWTAAMKQSTRGMLFEAQTWLSAQAQAHHTSVSFENFQYGLERDIVVDHIPMLGEDHLNVLPTLATKIGFQSVAALYAKLREGHPDLGGAAVLAFGNTGGRCFSLPYHEGLDASYSLESSMIYREHMNSPIRPSIFAHELLHLFGAADLYDERDHARDARNRGRFPNEIMLTVKSQLAENMVSPLTSWLVGWTSHQHHEFGELLPPGVYDWLRSHEVHGAARKRTPPPAALRAHGCWHR